MSYILPDNGQDIIDSREIISAIDELQSRGDDLSDYEKEALESLLRLHQIGESINDWFDGVTLVRDSYFKTYAMDFADEIGALPSDLSWPASCIDWDKAASDLQMDYTAIEFDGVTYWAR